MTNKKKTNWKKIIKCFLIVIAIMTFVGIISNQTVLADVGNNNRYEDTATFESDGGVSVDFGWLIYILFELFGPIPGLIIFIIIVIFLVRAAKKGKFRTLGKQSNLNIGVDNTMQVSNKIREIDPNFSEDKFIGWAKEVFMKIQQAWSERNWKIIRPFESQELFNQHSAQLDEYIKNHKINKIEKININYCTLRNFKIDGDKEVLTVELHAIMRDYVVDEKTNKVLESNPNKDWHMNYLMTFNRKVGVKTEAGISNKSTTNCPNCGAPTEITSSGQCEYCKSIITTGEHDWVLSDITSIR